MAAVVPIDVQTTNLVNGITTTIKIINRIDRKILITTFNTLNTILFSKIPSSFVTTKIIPIGTPIMMDIIRPAPTMYKVSYKDSKNTGQNQGSKLILCDLLYNRGLVSHKLNSFVNFLFIAVYIH